MTRILFASDLDGTLLPPATAEDSPRDLVARLLEKTDDWTLAYLTGRHLELALSGIEAAGLPRPDYLGCDVGTSLHRHRDGRWSPVTGYDDLMMERLGAESLEESREALLEIDDLSLQRPEAQKRFKLSFEFPPGRRDGIEVRVRDRLDADGIRTNLIFSTTEDESRGLLDVLPENTSKRTALEFLLDRLGLDHDHAFFAGDSGNDVDALASGVYGVLVGNAAPAVTEEVKRAARAAGRPDRIHFADAPHQAGVIEGLRRFGFI